MVNIDLVKWHADAAHLRDLIKHSGWDVLLGYAAKVEDETLEALLIANDAMTEYRKGYVAGLRRALRIPHEVARNVSDTQH